MFTGNCFKGSKGAAMSSKDKTSRFQGATRSQETDGNTETEEGASQACPGDGEVGGLLVQVRLARPHV